MWTENEALAPPSLAGLSQRASTGYESPDCEGGSDIRRASHATLC
jgi:hypothetical protein